MSEVATVLGLLPTLTTGGYPDFEISLVELLET